MFQIKICGITNADDALAAAAAGAGAVGLNFYPASPRFVGLEQARAIVAALPPGVLKVGVFVNAQAPAVTATCDELGLDLIQLHGDEPPEYLASLGERPTMRAFRLTAEGLPPVAAYLARCRDLGCLPRFVLLDAHRPGAYGGTGATCDWDAAAQYHSAGDLPPLVLAGGLTPSNVAEAIAAVRPAAVNTASGVESSPGRKDPVLVRAFVDAARRASGSARS